MSKTETKAEATEVKQEEKIEGYELCPSEIDIHFTMQVDEGAKIINYPVSHRISRFTDNEERLELARQEHMTETVKGETIHAGDRRSILCEIWEKVILGVAGYTVNGKPTRLEDPIPDALKARIPLSHRAAALGNLEKIRIRGENEEVEEITADVGFSISDNDVVKLTLVRGDEEFDVVYTFDEISPLEIAKAQLKIKESKAGQKTLHRMGSPKKILEFFDEKIKKVEGYLYQGKELMLEKSWLKLLPFDHKLTVLTKLQTKYGEDAKN